jgi:hypothetical protein
VKIPTQLRQCILADFVHLGSAVTQCILMPFAAGTRRATRFFIAYGRYDWLILLRFIDNLIVVPLGSPLIVDPIGIGVVNHNARTTRSSNFH